MSFPPWRYTLPPTVKRRQRAAVYGIQAVPLRHAIVPAFRALRFCMTCPSLTLTADFAPRLTVFSEVSRNGTFAYPKH